jgi:hypothetical protein
VIGCSWMSRAALAPFRRLQFAQRRTGARFVGRSGRKFLSCLIASKRTINLGWFKRVPFLNGAWQSSQVLLLSYANRSDYASGQESKIIEATGRKIAVDRLQEGRKKACPSSPRQRRGRLVRSPSLGEPANPTRTNGVPRVTARPPIHSRRALNHQTAPARGELRPPFHRRPRAGHPVHSQSCLTRRRCSVLLGVPIRTAPLSDAVSANAYPGQSSPATRAPGFGPASRPAPIYDCK